MASSNLAIQSSPSEEAGGASTSGVAGDDWSVTTWENHGSRAPFYPAASARRRTWGRATRGLQLLDFEQQFRFWCKLCLSEVSCNYMHTISSCGCYFCRPCLKQYLEVYIRDNVGIPFLSCPDGKCPASGLNSREPLNLISTEEIQLLVDAKSFDLFIKLKLHYEVLQDPNLVWCPTADCGAVVVIKSQRERTPWYINILRCPSLGRLLRRRRRRFSCHCLDCDNTFCSRCRKQWHPRGSCEEITEDSGLHLHQEQEIDTPAAVGDAIKACPRCAAWLQRDGGCPQIMCSRCSHFFCWHCLQDLDSDPLLRHYSDGPCKGRLGHGAVSLFWYRTQVMLSTACFGLLLVLVSPLILLGASCLFCSTCCCCCLCPGSVECTSQSPGAAEERQESVNGLIGRRRSGLGMTVLQSHEISDMIDEPLSGLESTTLRIREG